MSSFTPKSFAGVQRVSREKWAALLVGGKLGGEAKQREREREIESLDREEREKGSSVGLISVGGACANFRNVKGKNKIFNSEGRNYRIRK